MGRAELVAALVALAASWGSTFVVLRLARRWHLTDHPNARSAHRLPMPTAGGLGIAAGFWAGMLTLGWTGAAPCEPLGRAWAGGTAALLLLALDDLARPLGVAEKLVILCLAAAAWAAWGVPVEQLSLGRGIVVVLGLWAWPLTLLWLVAVCNACNFMDGIDGIAAVQAASVGTFAALALWRLGACWDVPLLLVAAAIGFLLLNFPPARIFMGDVGSGFLGFVLAGIGIVGARAGLPLWLFAACMGYFFFDTGYTLVRRALRGENVLRAHRKHLYQRLNRLGWSHRRIDLWVLLVNLVLGAGAYLQLFVAGPWGAMVLAAGAVLMAAQALWIERRDPDFG